MPRVYDRLRRICRHGAVPLYESIGFRHVEPYRVSEMPREVVKFMERPLDDAGQ
jgi:hypothetical protein